MNGQKILSVQDCNNINEHLEDFRRHVTNFFETTENSIKVFKNNSIAQSFFSSGVFGKDVEGELNKIHSVLTTYYNSLVSVEGLIPATKTIVDSQIDLLNQGYNGGR